MTVRGTIPHAENEDLIRLLSGELCESAAAKVKKHLTSCWECRRRYAQLEKVALQVVSFSKKKAGSRNRRPSDDDPFIARLERATREVVARPRWMRLVPHFHITWDFPRRRLLSGLAVAGAALALLLLWQRNLPPVSASSFMERAVAADRETQSRKKPGVVYQRILVRTAKQSFERTLYHDVAGRRQPKHAPETPEQVRLEAELALAGIDWESPLSPQSFATWHNEQHLVADEVSRTGQDLLTLRSTVRTGVVSQESFTVQESTFHSVERTVEFKDIGVVEFRELNFDILSWDAVNADLFEPLVTATNPSFPAAKNMGSAAVAPVIPLSQSQLDEAELKTRVQLNKLNAELAERLQLGRQPGGIEVTGIVATDARKQELESALKSVGHVSTKIVTFDTAATKSDAQNSITSVRSASVVERPTVLAAYLVAHGRSPEDSAALARQLFSAAVAVYQETKSLSELATRFSSESALTEDGAAALAELRSRHTKGLLAALDTEEKVLAETGNGASTHLPRWNTPNDPADSMSAAEGNLRLCKELSSGTGDATGTVEENVPEIMKTTVRLRAFAQSMATGPGSAGQSPKP